MFTNKLEIAAQKSLENYVGQTEALTLLYVQPDRAIFLANASGVVLKVYLDKAPLQKEYEVARMAQIAGVPTAEMIGLDVGECTVLTMKRVIGIPLSIDTKNSTKESGRYLRQFHCMGAKPPFSGGQNKWDDFILWWAFLEIDSLHQLSLCNEKERDVLRAHFRKLKPMLQTRPVVLLHGDLQRNHILVDQELDKVRAFIDFADAQPGDPLLDIAVLTLWNPEFIPLLLEGYESIEDNEETQTLISHYRLLRHIAEIPWLYHRGYKELANKNMLRVKEAINSVYV